MFGLSRLLVLAGKITWQPSGKIRWIHNPRQPLRRRVLEAEELEGRIVPTLLGQQLFPADYPWNQNIANAPVAANSAAIISHIGSSIKVHPDWGEDSASNGNSPLYGIPFNVVHGNSATKVNVIIDNYPGESDIVPVPMPANVVIEGDYQNGPNPNGPGYNANQRGDSHLIIWDEDNNIAYELFGAARPTDPVTMAGGSTGGKWHAAQESVWNMSTDSFRTLGYTSADAAGLSILAGLARPDEGLPTAQGGQGAINHALRFTLPSGDVNPQYIYPASHVVSDSSGSTKLPFGARLRLLNTPAVNSVISTLGPEAQIIAHAMQQYGLVLADIGSAMYVTGTSASLDANNNINFTWNMNDVLGLSSLTASDFQVVDLTPQVTGLSTSTGLAGNTITVIGQNISGSAGHLSVLFGGVAASSVTYVDDAHLTAVVPAGAGTVNVQVQSGVNETDPDNPNNNVNKPIFGYGTSATSSVDLFTYLTQTISGTNSTDSFASATDTSGVSDALTIVVKDTSGNAVSGLPSSAFSFALSSGTSAGSFGTVSETATHGTYTVAFTGTTAGTASSLTLTVSGVTLSTTPTVTVTAGAVSAGNSTVSFASPSVASGLTDTVTILVKDGAGNPISGLLGSAFSFALSAGTSAGTFGTFSETATKGTYTGIFTGTTAGTASKLSATISGVTLTTKPTIQVTAGGVSGTNSTVSFASPQVTSGNSDTVTIVVKDAAGNAISGLVNSVFGFALSGGTSTGSFGAVSESATKGTYTAAFTGAVMGTASTLTTTIGGVALNTTPTVQVTAGAVSKTNSTVSFASPNVVAGATDVVTIVVADGAGNAISGLPNSAFGFALSGGTSGGSFGSVSETATKGTYTATCTGTTAGTASSLTVTVSGVALNTKPTITVTTGAISSALSTVAFASATVAAGGADVVTVVLKDSAGNPITGLGNGAFSFALSGGTSAGTFGAVTESATKGTYTAIFTGTTLGTASTLTTTVSGVTLATKPPVTVLGGPSGTIATTTPIFSWAAVAGVGSYKLWLTDQTTGQVLVVPNLMGTTWTPTQPLALGDNYTWWIGTVQGQTTTWSSGLNFRIAPTGSGPSGTVVTNVPVFAWNSVTGAASYKIWLTDETTNQTTTVSNLTATSWSPSQPLTLGDNYTWWVGAVQGQTTAWDSALNFRIAPTGSGPSGTIATNLPAFAWNSVTGASSYKIWLTDQTTNQTTTVSNLMGTSWSPSQPLTLGDNYTWWVGAVQGQTTAWDSALSFRIAPTGNGPSGTIATSLPAFTWNTVIGAASYEVWLTDQTNGQNVITPNLTGISWTPAQPLTSGHSYIWWVGTVSATGAIAWDSPLTFTIS
jgi:hypothetical protein